MDGIPAHVLSRIAEHVSREVGKDVSPEDVSNVLDNARNPVAAYMGDQWVIATAIINEAREYGLLDSE